MSLKNDVDDIKNSPFWMLVVLLIVVLSVLALCTLGPKDQPHSHPTPRPTISPIPSPSVSPSRRIIPAEEIRKGRDK